MNIKERLSGERRNYWVNIVTHTNKKLEEYLLLYQSTEEFISKSYNVKLVVKCHSDFNYGLVIYLKINDEPYDWDGGTYIEAFKSDLAVRQYVESLNVQLFNGDYTPIMADYEFSIDELEDNEEVCIFEVELELEVD